MFKILRIAFCILTVAIAAVAIFIFVYAGWLWGLFAVLTAGVSGALMVTFKMLQEKKERKQAPPAPQGDFITGKVENGKEENGQ